MPSNIKLRIHNPHAERRCICHSDLFSTILYYNIPNSNFVKSSKSNKISPACCCTKWVCFIASNSTRSHSHSLSTKERKRKQVQAQHISAQIEINACSSRIHWIAKTLTNHTSLRPRPIRIVLSGSDMPKSRFLRWHSWTVPLQRMHF